MPWQQYLFHGDVTLMRRYYPVMEAYVALPGSGPPIHCFTGLGLVGDIGPKPPGWPAHADCSLPRFTTTTAGSWRRRRRCWASCKGGHYSKRAAIREP